MKRIQNALLNVLGGILGILGMTLAWFLTELVLLKWLPQIPIIPRILSWPVSYEWYATVGIISVAVFVGYGISNRICRFATYKYNYGTICLALVSALFFAYQIISSVANNRFSWTVLIVYGFAILTCIFMGIESAKNDNVAQDT